MKNLLKFLTLLLSLFISIFPVKFVFLPFAPYRILHILGLIYFFCYVSKKYRLKNFRQFVATYMILFLYSLLVVLINASSDFSYVIVVANMLLTIFSSFFIISLIKKSQRSFAFLCDIIILVFCLQEVISILMFIIPSIYKIIVSYIIIMDDYSAAMYRDLIAFRIVGVGNMGWAAGANYGFCLLLLTILPFLKNSIIYQKRYLYVLLIVSTLMIGLLSARTFMLFIVLSVVLYICLQKKGAIIYIANRLLKYSIPIILFIYGFYIVVSRYVETEIIEDTLSYAFEMFINFYESGNFAANSLEQNNEFYNVMPDSMSTWLIGDGIYSTDSGYYMGIDAGYIRQLFFFGIIGILIYWSCVYCFYKITYLRYRDVRIKKICKLMFLSCLILNYKGFIDMTIYVSLFYACAVLGIPENANSQSNLNAV